MTNSPDADESQPDGEPHLERMQHAALDMISAARSLLDAAEGFVSDRNRLRDAMDRVGSVVESFDSGTSVTDIAALADEFLGPPDGPSTAPVETDDPIEVIPVEE